MKILYINTLGAVRGEGYVGNLYTWRGYRDLTLPITTTYKRYRVPETGDTWSTVGGNFLYARMYE